MRDNDDATTEEALAAVQAARRVYMELKGVEVGAVRIAKAECQAMLGKYRKDERDHGVEHRWLLVWDVDWLHMRFMG